MPKCLDKFGPKILQQYMILLFHGVELLREIFQFLDKSQDKNTLHIGNINVDYREWSTEELDRDAFDEILMKFG